MKMKNVVFTWYELDKKPEDELKDYQYLIYQKEICPKTQRLHYQGYVVFKNHKRLATLKRMNPKAHFEKREATHTEAKTYCEKSDTHVEGPWTFGDDSNVPENAGYRTDLINIKKEIDQGKSVNSLMMQDDHFGTLSRTLRFFQEYEQEVLRVKNEKEFLEDCPKELEHKWQKDLYKSLETQHRREIAWVWSESGNMGKTQFANWVKANSELTVFFSTGGASRDIACSYNYEDIVIFDFTREKKDFINYSIIENFKDGKVFDSKYKSKMKLFKSKPVVVFANFPPEEEKISMNRIKLIQL